MGNTSILLISTNISYSCGMLGSSCVYSLIIVIIAFKFCLNCSFAPPVEKSLMFLKSICPKYSSQLYIYIYIYKSVYNMHTAALSVQEWSQSGFS